MVQPIYKFANWAGPVEEEVVRVRATFRQALSHRGRGAFLEGEKVELASKGAAASGRNRGKTSFLQEKQVSESGGRERNLILPPKKKGRKSFLVAGRPRKKNDHRRCTRLKRKKQRRRRRGVTVLEEI